MMLERRAAKSNTSKTKAKDNAPATHGKRQRQNQKRSDREKPNKNRHPEDEKQKGLPLSVDAKQTQKNKSLSTQNQEPEFKTKMASKQATRCYKRKFGHRNDPVKGRSTSRQVSPKRNSARNAVNQKGIALKEDEEERETHSSFSHHLVSQRTKSEKRCKFPFSLLKGEREAEKETSKFSNRIGLNESQCKNCSWQVQLPRALMPKRQTNELYAHGYKVFNRELNSTAHPTRERSKTIRTMREQRKGKHSSIMLPRHSSFHFPTR